MKAQTFQIPAAFLVGALLLITLDFCHSAPELALKCETDSDCTKQTANSKCHHNLCICLLGYEPINGTCHQLKCLNSTDCSSVFGNTSCVKTDSSHGKYFF